MSETDSHPLPPEVLADALQDRVHQDTGRVRAATAVRLRREQRLCDLGFDEVSEDQRSQNLDDIVDQLTLPKPGGQE